MVNAGFNPLKIISEQTGESMDSLSKKMSDGAISAKMVGDAMAYATGPSGRFFKGMENASKTFSGVMSTFRDNIGIALAAI